VRSGHPDLSQPRGLSPRKDPQRFKAELQHVDFVQIEISEHSHSIEFESAERITMLRSAAQRRLSYSNIAQGFQRWRECGTQAITYLQSAYAFHRCAIIDRLSRLLRNTTPAACGLRRTMCSKTAIARLFASEECV